MGYFQEGLKEELNRWGSQVLAGTTYRKGGQIETLRKFAVNTGYCVDWHENKGRIHRFDKVVCGYFTQSLYGSCSGRTAA